MDRRGYKAALLAMPMFLDVIRVRPPILIPLDRYPDSIKKVEEVFGTGSWGMGNNSSC